MELTTAEKFLLMAQHPDKGKFIVSDLHINHGIIGAFLLELSLNNKITIENDKVAVRDGDTSGNSILSEISRTIRDSGKTRQLKYWIGKLSNKSGVYKRSIMGELERKRQVRIERKKFLRLIPYTRYYLIDNRIRLGLIKEVKEAILSQREVTNGNFALLGLVEACKMHQILTTDKAELKILKRELKNLVKESPIATAVNQTIQQVQAAIISAIVVSSVATRSH